MALASINPATGETLETFDPMSTTDVDATIRAVAAAQREWRERPLEERAVPMARAASLLRARADDYARLMALEMGKPLKEGVAEANKCALACDHYVEFAAAGLGARQEPSDATRSEVHFDPLGVVLAVMPWNFPFWQVFRFIAPNLMAGNGGLLKHASNVPQCALAIEQLMGDAGFPPNLFRTLLIGSGEVADVIAHDEVAAVTLTGSEAAGRAVAAAAGQALKPSVLELGGSDPFIVLADADVEAAAYTAATARCINGGQSCIAAKRFIIQDAVYAAFLELFTRHMSAIRVGDPLDPATGIGPQARVDLRDELHGQVQQAVAEGAVLELGGAVPDRPGAWYPPTVLADVPRGCRVAREEIFGPVGAVLRARDAADAVAMANSTRFGLGASLWTADAAAATHWVPRIDAGAVFVNGLVKSDPRLPFGGVKASGYGRELGLEGLRAFVNVKTVWMR